MDILERIDRALHLQPRCRDCADNDGRCEHTGELCDPNEQADELMGLLRAEVERLADQLERTQGYEANLVGEVGRLKAKLRLQRQLVRETEKERDEARAEVGRLKAELRRVRQ